MICLITKDARWYVHKGRWRKAILPANGDRDRLEGGGTVGGSLDMALAHVVVNEIDPAKSWHHSPRRSE